MKTSVLVWSFLSVIIVSQKMQILKLYESYFWCTSPPFNTPPNLKSGAKYALLTFSWQNFN